MDFKDITEFEDQVFLYIRAGVQAIHITVGGQAHSAENTIRTVAKKFSYPVAFWDCLNGWNGGDKCKNFVEAVTSVTSAKPEHQGLFDKDTFIVLRDPHYELMQNPDAVAAVKLAIQKQSLNTKSSRRPLILLTPGDTMNPDLVPYMKKLEYPKPSQRQRLEYFDIVRASIAKAENRQCSDALRSQIASAAAGLSSIDCGDVFSESAIKHGGIRPEIIDTIEIEKGRLLKRSETLTYIPKAEILKADELGGYEELKKWLVERALAYEPEAEDIGLDFPKGIVLIGVPGTGKSVCADIIARTLRLPRVTFHIDAVFNSLVGESERRVREAIQTVDAMEGAVLLIDEADKVLGGAGEASGDSGVTRRVFGTILSWLSSKKNKTFVVMTMNRITGMPPELLRKGRFDEIFFVDTPDEEERKAILEIHLRKRRVDPAIYGANDWKEILTATKGFVGAEIEQAVIASRFSAYSENRASRGTPTAKQLIASLSEMVPITQVDPNNIAAIRKFGKDRARSVSTTRKAAKTRGGRALDIDLPFPSSDN